MNERIVNTIGAMVRRGARRFNQSCVYVSDVERSMRLIISVIGFDAEPKYRGEGVGAVVARRRSFLLDESEWNRIVQFVGTETTSRAGFVFVEQEENGERVYLADAPATQKRVANGAARLITATQIEGSN